MLKQRWDILRSPSFYPVRTHNKVIITCCLLHNLIRQQGEDLLDNEMEAMDPDAQGMENPSVGTMETSDEWAAFRDNLANQMFNDLH